MAPVTLVGLSGSLRVASMNTALLRAAQELAPDHVEVRLLSLREIPFFDADVEAEGLPAAVTALRAEVAAADGLLLASPEYNRSTTGVLKNAIDWLSRGPDSPLQRIPTGLLSAAGASGGAHAQAHLRDILVHNQVDVLDDSVQIARAWEHLVDGELVGGPQREQVAALVEKVAQRVRERSAADRAA